jgi:nicotinamide riboside transporter PnuC
VLALAALVAALRSRSWRYVIGALIVATFAFVYALASIAAIGVSRDPGGFGLM